MSNVNMSDQSSSFGPGMEEQHSELGGTPGQGMGGTASRLASQAGEKLMDTAEQQKRAGADFVGGMAGAVRRAASEFDDQMPQIGEYIRYAADQMETMSDSLRRRDIGQMMSDVQSFARRQPTAFLGMSFLAGFAAIRFLRSSANGGNGMSGSQRSARMAGDWRQDRAEDDGRYGMPDGGSASGTSGMGSAGYTPGSGSSGTGL